MEDIEFVHPVNLDDEGEGLPAYEESVSSGLSSFASDEGHYHDEAYVSRGKWPHHYKGLGLMEYSK